MKSSRRNTPAEEQGIGSDKATRGRCWGQALQSLLLPPRFKGAGLCTSFVKKPVHTSDITPHHLFPEGPCALANGTDPGEQRDKDETFRRGGRFIAGFSQELSLSQQNLSPPVTEETSRIFGATLTSLIALRHRWARARALPPPPPDPQPANLCIFACFLTRLAHCL